MKKNQKKSLTRLELLNVIFLEIGCERIDPTKQYLSRDEVNYLNGFISGIRGNSNGK